MLMDGDNLKKKPQIKTKTKTRPPLLSLSVLSLLLFFLFLLCCKHTPRSLIPISDKSLTFQVHECAVLSLNEKFLYYSPHSGFSNQLSEFKNAILMAAILNRTLIVPPILDHHAVVLGSCPKFRVLGPNEIRKAFWDHAFQLLRDHRYISIADVIDLSSLEYTKRVRLIDFRVFISSWCGVSLNFTCSNMLHADVLKSLNRCGSLLSGFNGNLDNCLYALQEDCRTTVWTFQQNDEGVLDSFQPDEQLRKKRNVSYIRKRRDIYKTFGSGSKGETAVVLAFGSLFTSPYKGSELYIDIHEAPGDQRIQSLIEMTKFIPFVPEIINAGREFAFNTIKAPFLCSQLRLLDGQFKNHQKTTFKALREKVESIREKGSFPIHIFVMTDLPKSNWSKTYLGDLSKETDFYKLFVLGKEDELVVRTAKNILKAGISMKVGSAMKSAGGMDLLKDYCPPWILPDVLLYIEEVVCSCASLGFVGTPGSTIAESVDLMRQSGACMTQD